MVSVTLIGEKLAKEGMEFVFRGDLPACKECKLRNVCFNLEQNAKYKITKLRNRLHPCKVHEGKVRVVEVEKVS